MSLSTDRGSPRFSAVWTGTDPEVYFGKVRTSSDTPLNKHTYEFAHRIYRAA